MATTASSAAPATVDRPSALHAEAPTVGRWLARAPTIVLRCGTVGAHGAASTLPGRTPRLAEVPETDGPVGAPEDRRAGNEGASRARELSRIQVALGHRHVVR